MGLVVFMMEVGGSGIDSMMLMMKVDGRGIDSAYDES